MPWSAGDAKSHTKKANTPAKQKKWADTANGVLDSCLKGGGEQKSCEAKAIRVANSKMTEEIMEKNELKKQKIPKSAFLFIDPECKADLSYQEFGEDHWTGLDKQILCYSRV